MTEQEQKQEKQRKQSLKSLHKELEETKQKLESLKGDYLNTGNQDQLEEIDNLTEKIQDLYDEIFAIESKEYIVAIEDLNFPEDSKITGENKELIKEMLNGLYDMTNLLIIKYKKSRAYNLYLASRLGLISDSLYNPQKINISDEDMTDWLNKMSRELREKSIGTEYTFGVPETDKTLGLVFNSEEEHFLSEDLEKEVVKETKSQLAEVQKATANGEDREIEESFLNLKLENAEALQNYAKYSKLISEYMESDYDEF
jgi:hypothetical protein